MRRIAPIAILMSILIPQVDGGIELFSFKQSENPRHSTLELLIKAPDTNVETTIQLGYPGDCRTMLENGAEKIMLSNPKSSIVAFNFQAGTKANDCVAMALLPSGRLVYFLDLNNTVARIVEKFRKGLEVSSFRVVDITDSGIRFAYTDHTATGLMFRVLAHMSPDGNLQISSEDIEDVPPLDQR